MARLPENFNIGDRTKLTIEDLLVLLERMYTDIAVAVNSKPDLYQREDNGQPTDTFLAQGSININTVTRKVEMLTEHTDAVSVIWSQLS